MKDQAQRQLIIDTAFAKFRQFGLRRVTVAEIASDLRISKKTLYQHFASKEELVRACLEEKIATHILPRAAAALASPGSSVERLRGVWEAFSQVPRLVTPVLFADLRAEHPHVWAEIDARRGAIIAGMESLFAEGIAAGEVHGNVHPRVATLMLQAIAERVLIPEVLGAGDFTPGEAITTVMNIFARGAFVHPPDPPESER